MKNILFMVLSFSIFLLFSCSDKEENELYDTELVIYAYDRIGVLLDLTRVFTESGITINNVNSR